MEDGTNMSNNNLKTFDNCQLTYIPQELLKLLLEYLYTLYTY